MLSALAALHKFLNTQTLTAAFPGNSQYAMGHDQAVIVGGILLAFNEEERLDNVCGELIKRSRGNPGKMSP